MEFGFKAGELCVEMKDALMPMKNRRPLVRFPVAIKTVRKVGKTRTTDDPSMKTNAGIKKGIPTLQVEAKGPQAVLSIAEETAFSRTDWQVTPKGPDGRPIWSFEVADGSSHLCGLWEETVGMVVTPTRACTAVAEFSSAARHLEVMSVDGLFANWTLPMIKALRLGVYREVCKGHLSRCELSYSENDSEPR